MIRASTFRPPVRRHPRLPIPVSYEVDERIRSESVRVAQHAGTHVTGSNYNLRRVVDSAALLVGDLSSIAVAVVTSVTAQSLMGNVIEMPTWVPLLMVFWATGGLFLRLYPGWGSGPADELRSLSRNTVFAGTATIVALSMAGTLEFQNRFVLLAATAIALFVVPVTRYAVRRALMFVGWWGVSAAVYGAGTSAQRLVHLLRDQPHVGLTPVAVFADDPTFWGHSIDGVPVVGDTQLVHPDASVAVLAVSGPEEQRSLVEGTLRYYRRVLFIPELAEHSSLVTNTMDIGGLLGLDLRINLASPISQFTKRTIDLVATLLTSFVWIPVSALGALAIWLEDRSNPFFAQRRMGRGGREIRVWKLRTMVPDAEGVLARMLLSDPKLRAEWEASSKLRSDPRVTRVGRLIRRLSIDELPQLWNVLLGEMSLVGPRPLPDYHEDRMPSSFRELRRSVRPGVTGLWQVSGRSDVEGEAMGWLDGYYVRNWSFWLDLTILFRTVRASIAGSGAY